MFLDSGTKTTDELRFLTAIARAPGDGSDAESPVETSFVERIGCEDAAELTCTNPGLGQLPRCEHAAGELTLISVENPDVSLRKHVSRNVRLDDRDVWCGLTPELARERVK